MNIGTTYQLFNCKKCGRKTYEVDVLYLDRDRMRSARYCYECHNLITEENIKDVIKSTINKLEYLIGEDN